MKWQVNFFAQEWHENQILSSMIMLMVFTNYSFELKCTPGKYFDVLVRNESQFYEDKTVIFLLLLLFSQNTKIVVDYLNKLRIVFDRSMRGSDARDMQSLIKICKKNHMLNAEDVLVLK